MVKLCHYDPSNPTVYFSLGEGIAALGLIFAAFQLRKPIWNMTLDIRGRALRNLHWLFVVLGLLSVLVAALLPQFLILHPTIFQYPIFWEMIALVSFAAGAFSFYWFGTHRKGLLTRKNAERFFQVLLHGAAVTRENNAEDVVKLTGANLKKIIQFASEVPRFPNDSWNAKEEAGSYCLSILSVVLTEPEIIKHIATSRIDFLLHLIGAIREGKLTHPDTRILFREISKELFVNPSSYLYRQLQYAGLGYEKPVYTALFRDQIVLDNYRPLQEWYYWKKDVIDRKYLEVYLQALETAIEGYWFDENAGLDHSLFASAFRQLSDAAQSVATAGRKEGVLPGTDTFWLLHDISSFFGRTFPLAYNNAVEKGKVKKTDINVQVSRDGDSDSITAYFIDGLFGYFEALSYIDDKDDEVRSLAIDATNAVIDKFSGDHQGYANMEQRLLKLFWERFEENVAGGYAPMIRVYISLILFPIGTYSPEQQLERNRLIRFLYEKVGPILRADPSKTSRFLPIFVVFNKKTKKFEWVMHGGGKVALIEGTTATVKPPRQALHRPIKR